MSANPYLCEWEEVKLGEEAVKVRDEFGLTARAAALMEGIAVAQLIDTHARLNGLPTTDLLKHMRALGIYLSELETALGDARAPTTHEGAS